MAKALSPSDYSRLLALRVGLRHFLHWSEQQARDAGLNPAQHQLLLAIKGHRGTDGPTIGDVADYLLLRHHSAVGLSQRTEDQGLIRRVHDRADQRLVRLELTAKGERALQRLSQQHLDELERLAQNLRPLWFGLNPTGDGAEP